MCAALEGDMFDDRLDRLYVPRAMTRAVVYGLLVTALAQGVLAGLGIWIFGDLGPGSPRCTHLPCSRMAPLGTAFVWVPLACP